MFSDSNETSGGGSSSTCCMTAAETSPSPEVSAPDLAALRRLSDNLESAFDSPASASFADARIVVAASSGGGCGGGGHRKVPVHRFVLAARSSFFRNVFTSAARKDGAPVELELKELARDFEVGYEALVAVLSYLYSGKVRPLPRTACVCVDEECEHVACRPTVEFLAEVLYASFVFEVSELVTLYQRHFLDILNKVISDDVLVVLSIANICGSACEKLLARCVDMIVKSDIDLVTLEKALPHHIVKQITDCRNEPSIDGADNSIFPDKHVKRIHRALDSDDVELVRMLLKEANTTLDDADALHYAVAYCDAKTTTELLDLGIADVNNRNSRGYTVLHVAAMRKEPKIIVSLLTKGALPSDLTLDGRKALQIAKRVTKAVDYYRSTEEGKPTPRDRLCIEILEQAERRDPLLGEASVSLAIAGDDLRLKLLYLENRVGLAKLLFPMEAKVAMDIAQVDGTSEFPLVDGRSKTLNGQTTAVDLNEAPFKFKEEHLNRLRALSRTVELGKRFFPRCSDVLNKIMDADDLSELACVGSDTPEERQLKRKRYIELQEVLGKAFDEDKEEFDRSGISSSSSSTSARATRPNKLTQK